MCYPPKSKCLGSIGLLLLLALIVCIPAIAAELRTPEGVRLLKNKSFDDSSKARKEILDLYKNLRVTDVLDGMDLIGLQDIGLMKKDIRPLWRDADKFSHRVVGFAITVRHVPTDVRVGQNSFSTVEGFKKFKSQQYARAPDAWLKTAKPGDIVVIDAGGIEECGFIGSNNSLGWAEKGVVGAITNGGARHRRDRQGQEDRRLLQERLQHARRSARQTHRRILQLPDQLRRSPRLSRRCRRR